VDANIWLIDMTEEEMRQRIRRGLGPFERPQMREATRYELDEDPVRLWEMGHKNEVVDYSERQMEALRKVSPSIPRVLIDERNALMAARLAWVVSQDPATANSKILAFVGAAHTKGINELLGDPVLIRDRLKRFNLSFSEPTLIRRVAVSAT
jgi:pheromone shutdown protein TraB